ncbi:MAG TPA: hypothetical protein VFE18_06780 [Phenylobacterium sp.]|jgi:hypothetical protein|uniref:hypothetical protein n=1 Tax=Phenylobacterium sp. TaxID=1871053 RepID=UPI002D710CA5|nr:hypothetical protein [Phenylobacterium sp.]HZZ67859.1 hypothetical protein [Phenylobacterium sp.]
MASLDSAPSADFFSGETWTWWQARRLRYNLTLAAGGWGGYGAAVAANYAFGHPVWRNWRGGLGMTLFLGTVFLVVMGFANVCYLLGPAIEAWVKPAEVDRYRRTTFAMGLWGSLLVPATFPLVQLALLIAHSKSG